MILWWFDSIQIHTSHYTVSLRNDLSPVSTQHPTTSRVIALRKSVLLQWRWHHHCIYHDLQDHYSMLDVFCVFYCERWYCHDILKYIIIFLMEMDVICSHCSLHIYTYTLIFKRTIYYYILLSLLYVCILYTFYWLVFGQFNYVTVPFTYDWIPTGLEGHQCSEVSSATFTSLRGLTGRNGRKMRWQSIILKGTNTPHLGTNTPPWELTHPTWGKGKSSSKVSWKTGMLVPGKVAWLTDRALIWKHITSWCCKLM